MTDSLEDGVLGKVKWRLLPMAMLLFFMSLLDRVDYDGHDIDDLALTYPWQERSRKADCFCGPVVR